MWNFSLCTHGKRFWAFGPLWNRFWSWSSMTSGRFYTKFNQLLLTCHSWTVNVGMWQTGPPCMQLHNMVLACIPWWQDHPPFCMKDELRLVLDVHAVVCMIHGGLDYLPHFTRVWWFAQGCLNGGWSRPLSFSREGGGGGKLSNGEVKCGLRSNFSMMHTVVFCLVVKSYNGMAYEPILWWSFR